MRLVIVAISYLFAVASCSRQNVESREVTQDIMVYDDSTSITEDSIATKNNEVKYDTVIMRFENEIVAYIKDTFLIKDADNRTYNWKEIDETTRSLNDWKYSENAVYIMDEIEWEDDSGCSGDTTYISRNGIKIATCFSDRCGDMSSCKFEYYYDNGKVGYKRSVNESFGGGCGRTYVEESKYSKDGRSIYEVTCLESEHLLNDSIIADGWIETTTTYESILKRDGKEVEVRYSETIDTLYYTIEEPDSEPISKVYTNNDDNDLPDMVGEAMSYCSSAVKH